ncbi:IS200/IS605 family transposase [Hymenobacter sp.]|uniref:IS200/IS605 family transposase n=1 Tax=Hymenobacter sp. TaxID=1898978 RepID=UPI002EDB82FE
MLRGTFKVALKASFYHLAKEQDFLIDPIETDKNYVHVLVDIPPTLSAFEVVHRLKGGSTYRLWKQYERYLLRYFWKERTLFSDDYFVCLTGEASTETVRLYIASQG